MLGGHREGSGPFQLVCQTTLWGKVAREFDMEGWVRCRHGVEWGNFVGRGRAWAKAQK